MRVDPVRVTEAHFDAKADRYQGALRVAPQARDLELLPFLLFLNSKLPLNPKELVAGDLLCGGGILTSAVRGCFKQIYGVDVSKAMLSYYPVGPGLKRIKGSLDEHSNLLTTQMSPDVILSLVGLHHVYEIVNGNVDPEQSGILQQTTLLKWAQTLPPHGVMVVADVTDQSVQLAQYHNNNALQNLWTDLASRYSEMAATLNKYLSLPIGLNQSLPETINEYTSGVLSNAPDASKARPAVWFREVVCRYGLYGHTDHFLNPSKLVSHLRTNGFEAEFYEMPTPWIFSSEDEFVYFFYEQFALGPKVDSIEGIPSEISDFIKDKVREYLGMNHLKHGGIAVGWRLGYYVISPRNSE